MGTLIALLLVVLLALFLTALLHRDAKIRRGKTIAMLVEESYPGKDSPRQGLLTSEITRVSTRVLGEHGLEVVSRNRPHDLLLRVQVEGSAVFADYTGAPRRRYSGARVDVTISLVPRKSFNYVRRFTGRVRNPEVIPEKSHVALTSAPYKGALDQVHFPKRLGGMLKKYPRKQPPASTKRRGTYFERVAAFAQQEGQRGRLP